MKRFTCCAAVAFLLTVSSAALAGGPPPACMVVDKVVLEPNDTAPTRIQIHGTFIVLEPTDEAYGPPRHGYLYYAAPRGKEAESRKEWAELQRLVSEKQAVAFGICRRPRIEGQLHPEEEKVTGADSYPVGQGGFSPASKYVSAKMLKDLRASSKRPGQ